MLEVVKDPRKVKAGKVGSASRWGERRHVNLRELHPTVAAAVRALIEADTNMKMAVKEGQNPFTAGGGGARDTSAAD